MRKFRLLAALLACIACAAVLFTGCSDLPDSDKETRQAEEPTQTPAPTEEPTEEPAEEPSATPEATEFLYDTFGTGDAEVLITNSTDFVFSGLSVMGPDETEFGGNLIPADQTVQQGTTFALSYTAPETTPAADEETGVQFNDDVWNIQLTTNDDKSYILYANDLTDMETAYLYYDEEGDVLYLDYASKKTGDVINTLESQLFMKDLESGSVIDELEPAAAADTSSSKNSGSSTSSGSGNASSGGTSSGSGNASSGSGNASSGGTSSSGSSGNTSSSGGASDNGSSGGNTSSSGSGSSGSDGSSGSSGGDDWSSGGDTGIGDCLEDNIIWND